MILYTKRSTHTTETTFQMIGSIAKMLSLGSSRPNGLTQFSYCSLNFPKESTVSVVHNYRYQNEFRNGGHGRDVNLIRREITTAYSGEPGDGLEGLEKIPYLPIQHALGTRKIEIGPFHSSEWSTGMTLMNLIVREGKSWPFETEFSTLDSYRSYFLSNSAFVVRATNDMKDSNGMISKKGDILGCFYIKPNFPDRCSHICNGGFITAPQFRRLGVARVMGLTFLRIAKDLGYKSSYFNLVFKSNTASVALWESLGFERVAVLEKAARLKGIEGLDTAYGYRFDLETLNNNHKRI